MILVELILNTYHVESVNGKNLILKDMRMYLKFVKRSKQCEKTYID